tara:strand:+ start:152 stop:928 length:777 start_codon:yes stop_codon:yes gene_type:complete
MNIVVSYVYYKSESADYNLRFFVENELSYRNSIDYIIVINGYECSIDIPELENVKVIKRENIGYDFGGHAASLCEMEKTYDYYFFMNSGVIGPIIPEYLKSLNVHWSNFFYKKLNSSIKLVGTSIVCLPSYDSGKYGPKIESFFFCTDNIGLKLLIDDGRIFRNHKNKYLAIVNGEYGISRCILKNGYNLDCMISKYQGINWRDKTVWNSNNNLHPSRNKSFFGESLNPYELIFHKWYWHNNETVNYEMIKQYVNNIC